MMMCNFGGENGLYWMDKSFQIGLDSLRLLTLCGAPKTQKAWKQKAKPCQVSRRVSECSANDS